jgi:hypothetical protein
VSFLNCVGQSSLSQAAHVLRVRNTPYIEREKATGIVKPACLQPSCIQRAPRYTTQMEAQQAAIADDNANHVLSQWGGDNSPSAAAAAVRALGRELGLGLAGR